MRGLCRLHCLFFMLISTLHILRKKMWWPAKTEMWKQTIKVFIQKSWIKSMLSKNIPILSCWMAPNSRVQQDCTCYTLITVVCTSFTFCISWEAQPVALLTSMIRTSIWFPFNQNSAEVEGVHMCAVNRRLPCWEATTGPSQTNIAPLSHRQPPSSLLPPLTSPLSSLA